MIEKRKKLIQNVTHYVTSKSYQSHKEHYLQNRALSSTTESDIPSINRAGLPTLAKHTHTQTIFSLLAILPDVELKHCDILSLNENY